MYWAGRRVLVTGGTGFIGSHLVEALITRGASVRVVGRDRQRLLTALKEQVEKVDFLGGDLRSSAFACKACSGIEAVFNLAGEVAGVGWNIKHPGTIFTNNVVIGLNVLDAAAKEGVKLFLCMSSGCVYRRHCTVPTPESEGFVDDPEPTNFGYGWGKRVLETQARCYINQFPMKIGIVRPYNAYGPRDNFEWDSSHVIPALIRKAVESRDAIVVWGDGMQRRSFIYVSDLVEGLLLALELYPECDPVNIGTEEEVTVAELIRLIVELTGSRVPVLFDQSRPTGQPRRRADLSKARAKLGFQPKVTLTEGLKKTIMWYLESRTP